MNDFQAGFFLALGILILSSFASADGTLSLVCPQSVMVSPTETFITASFVSSDGSAACPDTLNVTLPDKTLLILQKESCQKGRSAFRVDVPSRGTYNASTAWSSRRAECVFSAVGSPPRPVDEFHPLLILALTVMACFIATRKRKKA